jgi:predicted hydrocarbon binding protein
MVLNNFLDKFIFTSQLKFKDYNFQLLDIPFVIVPTDILLGLAERDDPEVNKIIYYTFKQSTSRLLIPKLKFGTTKQKFLQLAQEFFTASGWGLVQIVKMEEEQKMALITVEHSPITKNLKEKAKHPVDHYLRAVLAAIFSEYFETKVDCVESQCAALTPGNCAFIIKPLKDFDFSKEITQRQLSLQEE